MIAAIFDTETAPDWSRLDLFAPEQKPFDRDAIAVPGNYKKQETIDAYLDKQEADWPRIQQEARDAFVETTTLNGWMSRIYAFGWCAPQSDEIDVFQHDPMTMTDDDERELITEIVRRVEREIPQGIVAGWNLAFDLDHTVQRALVLRVPLFGYSHPWFRNPWFCDLMDRAKPSGQAKGNGLDNAAKAMGFGGKVDLGGRREWQVTADDADMGREYLRRDIELTRKIAELLT